MEKLFITLCLSLIIQSCKSQKTNSPNDKTSSFELNNIAMDIYLKNLENEDSIAKAVIYLEKSIFIDSSNITAYNNLVSMLCRLGRHEEALSVLDKLLKVKDSPEIKMVKGWLLECSGKINEALGIYNEINQYYEQELIKDPNNIDVAVNKCFSSIFINKGNKAKQEILNVEKKFGENIKIKNMIAIVTSFDKGSFLESVCGGDLFSFLVYK